MIPSPISSTPANTGTPLPPLQVITTANAAEVQLLKTLQIPGFKKSALSQCSVAFSPDGKFLSGVCYQNTIPVWDAQSGQLIRSLESSPIQEVAVAFSPDGKQIATGGFAGDIRLWDSETGQLLQTIDPLSSPIWELAFSPNGDRLASANFNRSSTPQGIHLWDTSNGDLLWDYKSDNKRLLVLSVDYSPDGKTLAYGTFDRMLILDAEKGTLIKLWPIPDHVGDLAFSSNGKFLATASDDHKIRLWETSNYDLRSTLEGHTHYVNGVAFSPDGKLIVSGSHDQKVGIWDAESGQLLNMLAGHENAVLRVAVNPAGTLIASISWDGTVRLWGVSSKLSAYAFPASIDPSQKYLFYLHGKIVEDQGIPAISPDYGEYEYEAILEKLASHGFTVISEQRQKNVDGMKYAVKVVEQITKLLEAGVPANNITVVGASKGASITVAISHLLQNTKTNFVLLGSCHPSTIEEWKQNQTFLYGNVLAIYDSADTEYAGSCEELFAFSEGKGLARRAEIVLHIGTGHGILYKPLDEWILPVVEWAR